MMELYTSEYKWMDVRTKLWAKNKEIETGIAAEVWVGANYFTQSLYYEEAYAPMFHRNDSIPRTWHASAVPRPHHTRWPSAPAP